MMLLALTVERYVSVCHPGQHTRPLCGPPHLTVALIPLATFLLYLPSIFRSEVTTCLLAPGGSLIYQKRENTSFLHSLFYQVYKVVLEIVFKIAPTILLAGFNVRIMVVYRRSCERRRRMTLSRTMSNDEDSRTFAEERRLILLLGSTSILFLVCVSPMVILNVTLSENNLSSFYYQASFSCVGQSSGSPQLLHNFLYLLSLFGGLSKHLDAYVTVALASQKWARWTKITYETFAIGKTHNNDDSAYNRCAKFHACQRLMKTKKKV
ncbi:hypothetical protein M0802_005330 [Mischocyttarus mexicanus]|nr:hypothetical protein M0802_005330 [Mischocyttarus mexicanus]